MNREVLDNWCERGILGLVLAILVAGPLSIGAVRTQEFLVIEAGTIVILILWGIRLWLKRRAQLLWPPICWAVLAFVIYAIVRYRTADVEYIARQELIHILTYAFLFLAILNNLHRQESIQIITFTLIFLAMAISIYAFYQFVTGNRKVPALGAAIESLFSRNKRWYFNTPYEHRATGTYINPNHLAGFLEMLLPLSLAYTLTGRVKPVAKIFLGYAALVMLAGIAVTGSRGGWISITLALLLFFGLLLSHRTYRLPAFLFLGVIVCAGFWLVPKAYFFKARASQLFLNGDINEDTRFSLWRPAYRIWQENIWWGAGPAHFDIRFRKYRPESVQAQPDRVHNDFLNTLADWGVAGAGLVVLALGLLFWGVIRQWRFVQPSTDLKIRHSNKFAFVLGASAGLAALLVHSIVDFNMHIPANAILAIGLMALLSSHWRLATERYWVKLGTWGKGLGSAAIAAGLLYLGGQSWRGAVEWAWLERASQVPISPEKVALLEKAFAVEPKNSETAHQIGEAWRIQAREGAEDYKELAEKAKEWFGRSIGLNRWDNHSLLYYGWCLDWMGRRDEAGSYFERAKELDPNGFLTLAYMGWHYVQVGNLAAAKKCFERSCWLERTPKENPIAHNYTVIVNRKLQEAAAEEPGIKPEFPPQ